MLSREKSDGPTFKDTNTVGEQGGVSKVVVLHDKRSTISWGGWRLENGNTCIAIEYILRAELKTIF